MIHPSVRVHPTARINCQEISIGAGGQINKNCIIEGTKVSIGREFWMDEGALIGGGSCNDPCASLQAGDWLHMGRNSQINIARGVTLGDQVGVGVETKIFTHGSYLNELQGFPVQFAPVSIGSNVWLPNAWINPGVTIGDNVVVGARSLVNRDIESGCLAAGSPAKILKRNIYPATLTKEDQEIILQRIVNECNSIVVSDPKIRLIDTGCIQVEDTQFECISGVIQGPVTSVSEVVRNQLRRHGIRFRYSAKDKEYVEWENLP